MDRGIFIDRTEAERTSLGKVLQRYAITLRKRGLAFVCMPEIGSAAQGSTGDSSA